MFHALNKEQLRSIVDLELVFVAKQVQESGMKLEVTLAAKDYLGTKGYDESFGARPLRRLLQDTVEDKLSEAILEEQYSAGDTILVDVEDEEIVLKPVEVAATPA